MTEGTNGFSSPRPDNFPVGLRVLVVDDDPTWLKILEKMLKKCSYEVTTCGLAIEALDWLRERKDGFDIVISDVNMPDMDGFKLLEHVGLEMDLPVIMMSVDGETSRVMRGVQHGACDYLLKPIRMKELRNIWQHVYRKKIHEVRDIESHEGFEEIQMMRNGSDQSDDGYLLCGGDVTKGKKRKDAEHKHDEKDFADPSSIKKARVVWTVDLHQKFVKAVNQIGFDKVGPKKILDLMNVPWLTRENVASHLQKYRLYLSRLQKENDLKTSSSGLKLSDLSSRDPAGDLPSPITMLHNDVPNCNYRSTPSNILVHNAIPRIHEGDLNGVVSLQTTEPKKVLTGFAPDSSHKVRSSRIGIISPSSFGSMEPDVKFPTFDSTFPTQFSWNSEVSEIQFKQERNPRFQLENGFSNLPLPNLHNQNQVNCQPVHSITHRPLGKERDKPSNIEIKSSYVVKNRENGFDSFSAQSQRLEPDLHPPDPIPSSSWSLKDQGLEQTSINDMEFPQKNIFLGRGSTFASFNGDLSACLLQGNQFSSMNPGTQNKGVISECNDPQLIAEVPSYLYDALRFDYEYPSDSLEYHVIDQGLFII